MQSINFNTGYKTYAINGDEENFIRLNVADINIYGRITEALEIIENLQKNIAGSNPTFEQLSKADKTVREQLNYAFGTDISSAAFGGQNCLSPVDDNGTTLFESFMNAFLPVFKADLERAASAQNNRIDAQLRNAKTEKYLTDKEA